jgi:hypothetical protein
VTLAAWARSTGVVVAVAAVAAVLELMLVCTVAAELPLKPLAASTASSPDSAAAVAAAPRVIADTRRRPESRARIARRFAWSGPLLSG